MAARIAMIAITTSSSIKVKPPAVHAWDFRQGPLNLRDRRAAPAERSFLVNVNTP
jgi:hypothetical protein